MMPSCDHTGTSPHFISSRMAGPAWRMSWRTWSSVAPRQSPSVLILASIDADACSPDWGAAAFLVAMCSVRLACEVRLRVDCNAFLADLEVQHRRARGVLADLANLLALRHVLLFLHQHDP